MTNQKFPFQRLPNDLCSMVLKTMDPHEIIAYSFTSKKALSMVRSFHLPIKKTKIKIGWPSVYLDFGESDVLFNWKMGDNEEGMTSFDDIPISVDVTTRKKSLTFDFLTMRFWPIFETTSFTWSNQEKSIVEWVKHLCSISRCERYEAEFHIGKIRFDLQSLQNTLPNLKSIEIYCYKPEPNEYEIQSVQNILRAFLPYVESIRLLRVPFQDNFSIQQIGMANLKELEIDCTRHQKFDDLLTWNVERCTIFEDHFSLRNLNRFFKLWKKGSNRKLKYLLIHGVNIADWNVLLKGLQPEEARRFQAEDDERVKEYIIQNSYGTCGRIKMYNNIPFLVSVEFTAVKIDS